jgi:hypothetical protein
MNVNRISAWIEASGVGITVLILAIAQGFPGIVAGGLLVLFWYTCPSLYTVGYGQIALGALLIPAGTTVQIVIAEIGLLLVLLTPGLRLDQPLARTLTTLGSVVLLVGGVLAGISLDVNHSQTGIILISVLGIVTYGMHRYERVAVGAIEESHE